MDIQGARAPTPVSWALNGRSDTAAPAATKAAPVAAAGVAGPLQGAPQIPAPAGRAAAGTSAEQARRQAEAIAKQLQEFVRSTARDLEFRVDEATGRAVVAVRNSSTGELIRQMPSEEALRILQHLNVGQPTVLDRTV